MIRGQRESATFATRREAQAWAERRKTELRAAAHGTISQIKTLRDAIERYAREISPGKRGRRWEAVRLNAFLGPGHAPMPVASKLADVTPDQLVAWRDARLRRTKPGTVLRDMTLMSALFETARREWRWIAVNPMRDVRRPPEPHHRERLISGPEVRAMLRALNHARGPSAPDGAALTGCQAIALCFLLALMTGMRAGELCAIGWADVHPDFVRLRTSKTGVGRDVPLTAGARRVIERLRGRCAQSVFGLAAASLSTLFRRARDQAGLGGFTFHDARHSAATRIAQRLHVLDLCRMFGWRQTDRAMTYYQPKASDIARRLSA